MGNRSFSTLLSLSFLIVTMSWNAAGAPYYRFWRGWQRPEIADFPKAISEIFIPATINQGAGMGLIAYLPALPYAKDEAKLQGLPEEIAMVIYSSKKAYDDLRATPEGQKYAKLHEDYFIITTSEGQKKSGSLTPESYPGTVQINHAYDLLESDEDWQLAENDRRAIRLVAKTAAPEIITQEVADQLDRYKGKFGKKELRSMIALVADKYYYLYAIWSDAEIADREMGGLKVTSTKTLDWKSAITAPFPH